MKLYKIVQEESVESDGTYSLMNKLFVLEDDMNMYRNLKKTDKFPW